VLPDAIAVCTNEQTRQTERGGTGRPGGERVHEHPSGISQMGISPRSGARIENNAAARAGAIGPKSYSSGAAPARLWLRGGEGWRG
jgi:hypothetical protein